MRLVRSKAVLLRLTESMRTGRERGCVPKLFPRVSTWASELTAGSSRVARARQIRVRFILIHYVYCDVIGHSPVAKPRQREEAMYRQRYKLHLVRGGYKGKVLVRSHRCGCRTRTFHTPHYAMCEGDVEGDGLLLPVTSVLEAFESLL